MFDWPEHSQTSLTSTSSKMMRFIQNRRVKGPRGLRGEVRAPLAMAFAVVVAGWTPSRVTVTLSPGSAAPRAAAYR